MDSKDVVTRLKDERIEPFRHIHTQKGRQEWGLYAIENEFLLKQALDSGAPLERIILTEGIVAEKAGLLSELEARNVPYYPVTAGLMRKLAPTRHIPSLIAAVRKDVFT